MFSILVPYFKTGAKIYQMDYIFRVEFLSPKAKVLQLKVSMYKTKLVQMFNAL